MTNPKSISDDLVEAALEAAYRADPGRFPPPSNIDAHDGMRAALAEAWNEIWGEGYTNGFEDREVSEEMAALVKKYGWAPHMTLWADDATIEQAETLFDAVTDAADELAPDHVTLGVTATLNPGGQRKEDPDA